MGEKFFYFFLVVLVLFFRKGKLKKIGARPTSQTKALSLSLSDVTAERNLLLRLSHIQGQKKIFDRSTLIISY